MNPKLIFIISLEGGKYLAHYGERSPRNLSDIEFKGAATRFGKVFTEQEFVAAWNADKLPFFSSYIRILEQVTPEEMGIKSCAEHLLKVWEDKELRNILKEKYAAIYGAVEFAKAFESLQVEDVNVGRDPDYHELPQT